MAQSSSSGTSSRRYGKDHESSTNSRLPYADSEWETKEAMRQRELEEARARAAQMEKTMKWWSDCTANWREKWSKVRNERNKAREEAKLLRTKLEIAVKDANSYKHESQDLELQNEQLRKEMEKIHMVLLKHAGQFDRQIVNILESDPQLRNSLGIDDLVELYNNVDKSPKIQSPVQMTSRRSPREETEGCLDPKAEGTDRDIEEYVLQGAVPKHAVELYKEGSLGSLERDITKLMKESSRLDSKMERLKSPTTSDPEESVKRRMVMLNLELEETTKAISAERDENTSLHRAIEKLKAEVGQLRARCKELEDSRVEAVRELTEMKDQYQIEIMAAQADLLDEASNREGMDQRMNELRAELERLQAENASEWGKRERLESEKLSLERENKQLRSELRESQERLEPRRSRVSSTIDADVRQLQQDLMDLKHVNSKLKKGLAEKTTELTHALRRSEQYETEVKRVRSRVDELKKELAVAQDEVDAASGSVRRLQRTNEDLIEQLESANVQIEHFKNSSEPSPHGMSEMEDKGRDDENDHSTADYEQRV
ncbi:coiled-coil domain-containing protein 102A [Diachasma alloeum]|uniref:coiled-coil domain-containing protein 102A n=1 Tax=Diachasma alloeum TaxID=454923 RepID=UPI00073831A1|nr:coiled-coil domain-containing protein 102A [Diachasma alloeum]XP_015127231.1 coiled-coil domain-containing protein 102A [Diachasma alloeum]